MAKSWSFNLLILSCFLSGTAKAQDFKLMGLAHAYGGEMKEALEWLNRI